MPKIATLILFLFTLSANNASAVVIWDESIDGDLFGLGTDVGNLQLGTNTLLGSGGGDSLAMRCMISSVLNRVKFIN